MNTHRVSLLTLSNGNNLFVLIDRRDRVTPLKPLPNPFEPSLSLDSYRYRDSLLFTLLIFLSSAVRASERESSLSQFALAYSQPVLTPHGRLSARLW